ncbi:hypothetical protein Goari_000684 [Gossypium aridum]|uniref:Uncharacterized protein n=1 Tax=Gossypium aridum TaxID=34290 RepID=A0A7J8YHF9_GOSAI|nr:hypothetical protein [Gossypium aridum]
MDLIYMKVVSNVKSLLLQRCEMK